MKEKLVKEIGQMFLILSQVGKGAFSKVYECINTQTHKTVAVKVIKKYKQNPKLLSLSIQESRILEKLDHPNIVKFYALHHTPSFLLIEMEFLKERSLAELLLRRTLSEEEASTIMSIIFKAVNYLHKVHIIHRDLKPENIIFADQNLDSLKIADFGLSAEFKIGEKLDTQTGTIIYMSPELLNQSKYNESADIWSCGIILYKLLTNTHPLYVPGESTTSYKKKIQNIHWKFPKKVSELAKDLFLRCVCVNPMERYSANLALSHPWISHCSTKIPKTHIEEVRMHLDSLKIKSVLLGTMYLAAIVYKNKPKNIMYKVNITEPETEKSYEIRLDSEYRINIKKKRDMKKKQMTEKIIIDSPKKNARMPKLLFNNLIDLGKSRSSASINNKRGFNKIQLSPITVAPTPKSAER